MKKLLLLTFSVAFVGLVQAQDCTSLINMSATTIGLNPNPPVGSYGGIPYDEVNTLVIPKSVDNTLTPAPGDSIPLCEIQVLNVIGMPAGYTYDVWAFHSSSPTSNYDVLAQSVDTIHIFQNSPITRVCIRLKNSFPPGQTDNSDGMLDRDSVDVKVAVGAWADLGFGCSSLVGAGGTDTFDLNLCIHSDPAGIEDEYGNKFSVESNFPNPATNITYLNFTTPVAGETSVNIYDAVGRNVLSYTAMSYAGKNTYGINTEEFKNGVYFYNITYKGKTISRKMIVNK